MKAIAYTLITAVTLWLTGCYKTESSLTITSPDNTIRLTVFMENDSLVYTVSKDGKLAIDRSLLGLTFKNSSNYDGLNWVGASEIVAIEENYKLYHGKRTNNIYKAHEAILSLSGQANSNMNIRFRVSDDGVAFRYEFPEESSDTLKIINELTSFSFPEETSAWLQPKAKAKTGWSKTNPSYEENYQVNIPVATPAPTDAGWVYPALFNVDSTWVLITESGLDRNYCGTNLQQHSPNGVYQVGFPEPVEGVFGGPVNPQSTLPWKTPWRVIGIGSLATIVESNLGNALAEPAIALDESIVKPGPASWSWAILKDNSITYYIQKKFIDFASEMNWPYCLIDVNWDTTIGYDGIQELVDYGKTKNVGLILWYNSAGDWNYVTYHPKDLLTTSEGRNQEFSRIQEMGIKGVKVDFFGGDGQSVINYYHDMLTDAAKYNLLVNFHGTTLPRGWHRTYPNLMTMESIKGFEFITFEQSNADLGPEHCAIIPFTRNAYDPMDFTPMNLTGIPNIDRRSSPAFELALPVLFLSGIQHMAETPEMLKKVPDYVIDYLKDIPTDWEDSKFLAGYPGKFAVVARLKNQTWHVVAINATDDPIELNLDLTFLDQNQGYLITDGNENGFNKRSLEISGSATPISLAPKGGVVMKF